MVAVEMKDGKIIGGFNDDVNHLVASMKPRLPEGLEIQKLSDQPRLSLIASTISSAPLLKPSSLSLS